MKPPISWNWTPTSVADQTLRGNTIWNELEKAIGAFLQQVTLQTLLDTEDKVREELQHETPDLVVLDSN